MREICGEEKDNDIIQLLLSVIFFSPHRLVL